MKPEDILTLLNAGYTKEEIDAMIADPATPAAPAADPATPATPASPAADPATPATPAADPEQPTAPAAPVPDYGAMIAQLTQQVSGLTQAVQLANLRGAQLPPEKTETAEDILAELINPTYKKPDK